MNEILEKLNDIEGLDAISTWPFAIGWWILIGLVLFFALGAAYFIASWIAFKRSWKNDALQKLKELDNALSEDTTQETVRTLSEYLRRIAVQRYKREECAGLVGEEWLKWLKEHDPKCFDWQKRGLLLIEAPYAPGDSHFSVQEIKSLIQAIKHWMQ